ncbi:MAG TPA: hypothetical protein VGF19_03485 [Candidatus Acidoferrum sp.]|jgi:hypothetical protein
MARIRIDNFDAFDTFDNFYVKDRGPTIGSNFTTSGTVFARDANG